MSAWHADLAAALDGDPRAVLVSVALRPDLSEAETDAAAQPPVSEELAKRATPSRSIRQLQPVNSGALRQEAQKRQPGRVICFCL